MSVTSGGSGSSDTLRSDVIPSLTPAASPTIVWLDGDVLACACPQCHALMSIRAWLMVGDCSRCGTSVELTEEQEREVLRLLRLRKQTRAAPAPAPITPAPPVQAAPVALPPAPPPSPPKVREVEPPPAAPPPVAPPAPPPAAPKPAKPAVRPAPAAEEDEEEIESEIFTRNLPAWLVSMIVHLVIVLLLGLWVRSVEKHSQITLSSVVGTHHVEGEPALEDLNHDEVVFEDPGTMPLDAAPIEELTAQPVEVNPPAMNVFGALPSIDVTHELASVGRERMFAGRDERVRAKVADAEGGTTYTEAAVTRGLRWLAKHQSKDGSWSLSAFDRAGECNGRCRHTGRESSTAGTALALLPFLGAGQTHKQGRYKTQVAAGIDYLVSKQLYDGSLMGDGVGQMYAHGQASIVLCEAYAMTGDKNLWLPAQKSIDFIVKAQHREGGWRYTPGEEGDTSVVGWQIMALQSAKLARLKVPSHVLRKAEHFLDSVQTDKVGGQYTYQAGMPASPAMSAEALLCRQYLGWPAKHRGLQRGAAELLEKYPPDRGAPNIYYWYYATQVLHHLGDEKWERWNHMLRDVLVDMQETKGHEEGSWTPAGGVYGGHDTNVGGRLYMTSLAICTLEVYYRHLPIYRSIDVNDCKKCEEPEAQDKQTTTLTAETQ